MVKLQGVVIGVDEYDTALSNFAWDVISLDRSNTPIFVFSKLASVNPVHPTATTTTTTPIQVVQGLELHRTMHMPDIAMVAPANLGMFG